MKIASTQLIEDLQKRTLQLLQEAQHLQKLPKEALNWKASPDSWSILECLEHLNLYGDFYLPTFREKISSSNYPAVPLFSSGLLGNYFATSMLPKEKLNKMKTFQDKNPAGNTLTIETVARFISQQQQLLEVLELAARVNLNKVKVPITITTLLRLRLGDTLRFVIYHNQRHLQQAERVLQAYKSKGTPAVVSIP